MHEQCPSPSSETGIHRQFIDDFIAEVTPCLAFGMIEERKQKLGLMALRPGQVIPSEITEPGFNFGHSLLGNVHIEVVHFAFEFYGFATYNVLINPNNPPVQAVLDTIIGSGEYFVLVIGANQGVTAFRSQIGQQDLVGLTDNLMRIKKFDHERCAIPTGVESIPENPHSRPGNC